MIACGKSGVALLVFFAVGISIGHLNVVSLDQISSNNKHVRSSSTVEAALHDLKNHYEAQLAEQATQYESQIAKIEQRQVNIVEHAALLKSKDEQHSVKMTVKRPRLPAKETTVAATAAMQNNGDHGVLVAEQYPLQYYPFELKGHDYFLPSYAMHRPAVKAFLDGKYMEPGTHCIMERLLPSFPGSMVHAGTFFGDMIPHFSSILDSVSTMTSANTEYQLYAFEPNTRNYLLAQKAVEANELGNVVLVNAALGPTVVQQRIQVVVDNDLSSQKNKEMGGDSMVSDTGTQRVPQLTIDMFHITDLSVLQLDTEGFEEYILQGALQTLQNTDTRPNVIALEDVKRTAKPLMQETLPEYVFIRRMSNLDYYALVDFHDEVKQILDECRGQW